MTRCYRYARNALIGEYARGISGLALTAGPLALLQPAPAVGWVLGAGASLFLIYCTRSVLRQLTRIEMDEAGVAARGPLGTAIRWRDLRSVRLNFYSTQRDRSRGWMQLVLCGARRSITIDSGVSGFAEIARAAARAALQGGRPLDERTRMHLRVLGLRLAAEPDTEY